MTSRPVLGAGLKMYLSYTQTVSWLGELATRVGAHPAVVSGQVEVFALPGFTGLESAQNLLGGTKVRWGAQDVHHEDSGAFTGEVSVVDLAELGCRYVEVGHKERITQWGETPELIAAKTAQVLRHGLVPIICVGEEQRRSADDAAAVCLDQMASYTARARAEGLSGPIVVAYEPHWAIGADTPAPAEYVTEVVAGIRSSLSGFSEVTYLYGGTAGPGVLDEIYPTCDGLFLGRSSHSIDNLVGMVDDALALVN